MVEVAVVKIWDHDVGAVSWDANRNVALFEYYPDFIKIGLNVSPIKMPLSGSENVIYEFTGLARETFYGLPGMLADSLPDKFGNTIINTWLAKQGRTPSQMSPIERLCYIGNRGMGALEYSPAIRSNTKAERIDIEEMSTVVSDIVSMRDSLITNSHSSTVVKDIISVGTSAGGARAKAVIAYNKENGNILSGQLRAPQGYDHWLLKFDGVNSENDPEGFGKIEYAYYKMAIASQIEMSECQLFKVSNHAHFMTKRFDRIGNSKLHLQTLCGLAHYDYNQPNQYSYEDAFNIMRQLRLPYSAAEQLYRRMVFNVIMLNRDDHTKNFSFLMDESGQWKLAPAYDLTFSYRPDSPWVSKHQLSINGKRDKIERIDLSAIASAMNIKKPNDIIDEIIDVRSNWRHYAKECDVPEMQIQQIENTILKETGMLT